MQEYSDEQVYHLLDLVKAGDKKAQALLVEKNIGLVWSMVKRFQNRGYESDDIFQIGCIGLIKAIDKFDRKFEVKFSTYAVPMIVGEIKRFLRDDGMIKVSRSLKETASKSRVVRELMSKELGREPTVHEMAERMGLNPEDLVMAIEAGYAPESLYASAGDGENSQILLIDRIQGGGSGNEAEIIDKIALKQVLDTLQPRERQIIILRYFKGKTQIQIAKHLGISQVQVSRIEKRILEEIRRKITG